jgi:hypothetical protein
MLAIKTNDFSIAASSRASYGGFGTFVELHPLGSVVIACQNREECL